MKIATYNVNGVNGRLPRLLEWLDEAKPDILCLQELKTDDTKFPAKPIADAGYCAIWHGQRAHHGVAILARGETPEERRRGLPGEPSDAATRYLEADVKGVVVASVYLPNGNPVPSPNYDYKLRWFARFLAHAKTLAAERRPVILAGDLNVIPTDFDIYNAWLWRGDAVMQDAPRAAFRELAGQGWVDTARALHPGTRVYTYFHNRFAYQRRQGMRLDFILVNAPAAARVEATGVDVEFNAREKSSDHVPTWIELR